MARDLIRITKDYWAVSHALKAPDGGALTTGDALKLLNSSDKLRPTDWRLRDLMHTIRYDIIEGHSEWREKRRVVGSVSILPTKG